MGLEPSRKSWNPFINGVLCLLKMHLERWLMNGPLKNGESRMLCGIMTYPRALGMKQVVARGE